MNLPKLDYKTENTSLAYIKDGRMISGYTGEDVLYYTHICYPSMMYTLDLLKNKVDEEKREDIVILETGCASHGTSSTLLWDSFVKEHGGSVVSVDLSEDNVRRCREQVSNHTTVIQSDSVTFLKTYNGPPIDFVYLDSMDCNFFQDNGSCLHHLFEFMQLIPHLKDGSLILIDDTPKDKYWLDNALQLEYLDKLPEGNILWGKGKYVMFYLEKYTNSKLLYHAYQVLFEYHR